MAGGCAGFAGHVRRYTYPPDFKYVERGELRSAMWRLARDVNELDRVMRRDGPIDESRRAEVAALLDAMLADTEAIRTDGRPSNHPLLTAHVEGFRQDVLVARRSLQSERPNYFLVGTVSGACLVCHGTDH